MNLLDFFRNPSLQMEGYVNRESNSTEPINFYIPNGQETKNVLVDVKFENSYWDGDPDAGLPDREVFHDAPQIEIETVYGFDGDEVDFTDDQHWGLVEQIITEKIFN